MDVRNNEFNECKSVYFCFTSINEKKEAQSHCNFFRQVAHKSYIEQTTFGFKRETQSSEKKISVEILMEE